ncbi:MAG TPA: hypothetical protein VFB73_06230 [Chloroflexota bacterium]|nr:hypothetical protein [Chloroflexota bacterium]
MSDDMAGATPAEWRRAQARERVIQRLGLVSLVIWVVGVLAFMVLVYPARPFKPSVGMLVGMLCFALAALPWLAYGWLVERASREGESETRPPARQERSPLVGDGGEPPGA